jgi:murein DD-endopeptidase MepM/ murein hydrolase activator NlpD
MKTYRLHIIAVLIILIAGFGFWFFNSWGELEKPSIQPDQDLTAIGRFKTFNIAFADRKSGLRNSTVTIVQDNQTQALSSLNYVDQVTRENNVSVTIDPVAIKLHEGPATLYVSATDNSLWKNETTLAIQVNIDFMPPQIFLLTSTNHINPGGTCVILYRTSKPVILSGVMVEKNFSQGYATTISEKPCTISYFSLPMDAKHGGTTIKVIARDQAGNEASIALPSLIRNKKFRSDKMTLSENFLQQKMPEFQSHNPALQGKTPLDTFIYVNGKMREENDNAIRDICRTSNPRQLWEGTFLRMKNAAPMALFGDKRKYLYHGTVVGESIHTGVDLASTTNAPVEAANHGIVTYAGYLGIYGNFVIIDHGFGFFTVYGHFNSIDVKKGQAVRKGDIIGHTGSSGLAGGDHLHFGMLIGGQFVNPQEWWDTHWIEDNVTKKMAISY